MEPALPLTTVINAAKALPLPAHKWALWAADCAERALPLYEAAYPDDNRPRQAIAAYAANAADAAAYAAYAANAAAYAANAARAADAADAAYAADAAAYAANAARAERTWQAIRLIHYMSTGE